MKLTGHASSKDGKAVIATLAILAVSMISHKEVMLWTRSKTTTSVAKAAM
jgi:hypothetical protein